jgi:hypothetical protein
MRRLARYSAWLLLVVASCGDDGDSQGVLGDASMPDAAVSLDAGGAADASGDGIDAGEGPADAGASEPDAAPSGMVIESIQTADGYTQVRQGSIFPDGSSVDLVIAGERLADVTSVTVGEFVISLRDVTDREVRVRFPVPHAARLGPRQVTVTSPEESVAVAGAIEVTPYVVAPSASASGHGTFQSPMTICNDQVRRSRAGDTILLLEGAHTCSQFRIWLEEGGQIFQGQGVAETSLGVAADGFHGFDLLPPNPEAVTTFRDLTIISANVGPTIRLWDRGSLLVERVALNGLGISLGNCSDCETRATIRGASFTSSQIEASGRAQLDVFDSAFSQGAVCIHASGGRFLVTNSTFESCFIGVLLERGDPSSEPVRGEIRDSVLVDNQTGIAQRAGRLTVTDTSIRQTAGSSGPFDRGIRINRGELEASRVTITGQGVAGIEAFVSAAEVDSARVTLADVLVEGGQYGVYLHGSSEGGGLFMRSSIVRDQTVAAVSLGFARAVRHDLNGNNQLSVVSGVALDDARVDPVFGTIEAAGMTLNGTSYTGLIEGPAERLPDYRIVDDRGVIEFSP